jgi:DNA ligase D-like protein (predicted ligase)
MAGDLFDTLDEAQRQKLRRRTQPDWVSPMLATLTDRRFSDTDWLYERKLDGERCLASCRGDEVQLLSRNRKKLNDTYPELVDALSESAGSDLIVDGEIVAFTGNRTDFARLQGRLGITEPVKARRSKIAVYFYLFDLLYADGYDTTRLPLIDRKKLLKQALTFNDPLRFTAHRRRGGEDYFHESCRKGWEGLIVKRAAAPYRHGRSRDWLKFKCVNQQELIVVGYTDPQGGRVGFGALLLGYYQRGDLRYAGKVGTGFDGKTLRHLHDRLAQLDRKTTPCVDHPSVRNAHWVAPHLVAEVAFTEWTADNRLRHPRYLGLRDDKAPEEVRRETHAS